MFKDTCLVALKIKDRSPRIIDLEILVYMLLKSSYTLVLKVFVCLILWSSFVGYGTNSLNAQAYNHTNVIIIRI
jgi:hypothetical protein